MYNYPTTKVIGRSIMCVYGWGNCPTLLISYSYRAYLKICMFQSNQLQWILKVGQKTLRTAVKFWETLCAKHRLPS